MPLEQELFDTLQVSWYLKGQTDKIIIFYWLILGLDQFPIVSASVHRGEGEQRRFRHRPDHAQQGRVQK